MNIDRCRNYYQHTHTLSNTLHTRVGVLCSLAGDLRQPSKGADPIPPADASPKRLTELLTLQILIDLDIDRLCHSTYGCLCTFTLLLTRPDI